MELTPAQMRAIELILEQMDRFNSFSAARTRPIDLVVRTFYADAFEARILDKISKLLAPDSKEDLTMTWRL